MTLKKGDRGEAVKTLQKYLHLYADGIFGTLTEETVKKFQRDNDLTPDGIVGDKTWKRLTDLYGTITTGLLKANRKINGIILHCTATPEGREVTVEQVTQMHKLRGWSTIGYHYLIGLDGKINAGRNINTIGAHCEGHNTGTIGIAYVGGVEADGKTPKDTRTPAQKTALVKLVRQLMNAYLLNAEAIHCHNEYAAKACPSFKISDFRNELK